MWIIIGLIITAALLWGWSFYELKDHIIKQVEADFDRLKQEGTISNMIKEASINVKKLPIEKGYIFDIPGECFVLGTFFDQDVKFATFCHMINKKLVSYPGVAEISDANEIEFSSANVTKEVKEKSMRVYLNFRQNNKSRFMEEEDEL